MVNTIEDVHNAIKELSREELTALNTFEQRFSKLYENTRGMQLILSHLKLLKEEEKFSEQKHIIGIILRTIEHLEEVTLPVYKDVLPELRAKVHAQARLTHEAVELDAEELKKMQELSTPDASPKIKRAIDFMRRTVSKDATIEQGIQQLEELLNKLEVYTQREQEIIRRESKVIDETQEVLENWSQNQVKTSLDALAFEWLSVQRELAQVFRAFREEVHKPFQMILQRIKQDAPLKRAAGIAGILTSTKAGGLFGFAKEKIGKEDIRPYLRTLTTPQELMEFRSTLQENPSVELSDEAKKLLDRTTQAMESASYFERASLSYEATTDPLTGLWTRRYFREQMNTAIADYKRDRVKFAIALFDIDHFKKFNDTYGHEVGDKVLQFISVRIKDSIRPRDVACRWGGEEIAILFNRAQDISDEAEVVERIMAKIKRKSKELMKEINEEMKDAIPVEMQIHEITMSGGLAMHPEDSTLAEEPNYDELIGVADERMYKSKKSGRNRLTSRYTKEIKTKANHTT